MSNYFEINYFKKVARINYLALAIFLAVSVTSHSIANRLTLIAGYPIISAGYIYMFVFVLTDVLASYNSRRLVIYFISLEALCNFIYIFFAKLIVNMPYPTFFNHVYEYKIVFDPLVPLYFANLGGNFVAAVFDLFIFWYLYKNRRWIFCAASFTSSIVTLTMYTYITDYFGFRGTYPTHVIQITNVNVITNFITLAFYSIVAQFIVYRIQRILNKANK